MQQPEQERSGNFQQADRPARTVDSTSFRPPPPGQPEGRPAHKNRNARERSRPFGHRVGGLPTDPPWSHTATLGTRFEVCVTTVTSRDANVPGCHQRRRQCRGRGPFKVKTSKAEEIIGAAGMRSKCNSAAKSATPKTIPCRSTLCRITNGMFDHRISGQSHRSAAIAEAATPIKTVASNNVSRRICRTLNANAC